MEAIGGNPIPKLHGTSIKFGHLERMPPRRAFLPLASEFDKKIDRREPLFFMPTAVHETNMYFNQYEYAICLFGVLEDGRRATVVVTDIEPELLVEVPMDRFEDPEEWAQGLVSSLREMPSVYEPEKSRFKFEYELQKKRFFRYENVPAWYRGYAQDVTEYPDEPKPYSHLRLIFKQSNQRRDAIRVLDDKGLKLALDDSVYYRVFSRNTKISLSDWCWLSKYEIGHNKALKDEHLFIVHYKNLESKPKTMKDKTLTCYWDIETYSPKGAVPQPELKDNKIIMISLVFFQCHNQNPMIQICIVDQPCPPNEEYLTVVCSNEKEVLKAFAFLLGHFQPEILGGFNTTGYDWPWIVMRAAETPGLASQLVQQMTPLTKTIKDEDIIDLKTFIEKRKESKFKGSRSVWNGLKFKTFRTDVVKVDAENDVVEHYIDLPGHVDLDVRTIFYKRDKTCEKQTLAYFLETNDIKGKKDMPPEEIHLRYRELLAAKESPNCTRSTLKKHLNLYQEIALYCVYDSIRCHELMLKCSCINADRYMATLTYVSLSDVLKYAGGLRLRNLLYSVGWEHDIVHTNRHIQHPNEGQYSGAYVLQPKRTGIYAPKLSIDERIKKYLSSLSLEETIEALKDLLKRNNVKLGTFDSSYKSNKKVLEVVPPAWFEALDQAAQGTKVPLRVHSREKYKEWTTMNAKEIQKWKDYVYKAIKDGQA